MKFVDKEKSFQFSTFTRIRLFADMLHLGIKMTYMELNKELNEELYQELND